MPAAQVSSPRLAAPAFCAGLLALAAALLPPRASATLDDDVVVAVPAVQAAAAPARTVRATVFVHQKGANKTVWRKREDGRFARVDARPDAAAIAAARAGLPPDVLAGEVQATSAYVLDVDRSAVLYAKNENQVRPIASITKLMSALVVLEGLQPLDETVEITQADAAALVTGSRLAVGTRLTRQELLHLSLMSSENRATQALARTYPGGLPAFVQAMNAKAAALGMHTTRFVEPTGLSSENISSPHDLVRLMLAAAHEPLIRRYTTDGDHEVRTAAGGVLAYHNTNMLVRDPAWTIDVSKTGYISSAGRCLVMLTRIDGRRTAFVVLGSSDNLARVADAVRLRQIVVASAN